MTAYYNEIEPFAADWLENLIAGGHIAPGVVDRRSIEDVQPDDLRGFTQCHFFAGIGVWSHALRLAGWPDDRPVWTGSCPCQPFSGAGKGLGVDDPRHLWPAWLRLIRQCRPTEILGEQVAGGDGLVWADIVQPDLEGEDYACGILDTCSAGHRAPHIRQRLRIAAYDLRSSGGWVADADGHGRQPGREGQPPMGHGAPAEPDRGAGRMADATDIGRELRDGGSGVQGTHAATRGRDVETGGERSPGWMADSRSTGLEGRDLGEVGRERAPFERGGCPGGVADTELPRTSRYGRNSGEGATQAGLWRRSSDSREPGGVADAGSTGTGRYTRAVSGTERSITGWGADPSQPFDATGGVADAGSKRRERGQGVSSGGIHDGEDAGRVESDDGPVGGRQAGDGPHRPGPLDGFWRAADWLLCRDGKWRPVEPGTFPLAHGVTARVGKLRAFGNAIDAQATKAFIETYLEVTGR